MPLVALQPSGSSASKEHYADTIESPVEQERLYPHLPETSVGDIERIYGDGRVPVWGVTPSKTGQNAKKLDRLRVGDVALFVHQGLVFASGILTHKIQSHTLASDLWSVNEDGSTWECVYLLDEIVGQAIPVIELNQVVGYKESNVVQGFTVLGVPPL